MSQLVETLHGNGTLILPDDRVSVDYVMRVFANDSAAGRLAGFVQGDVVFAVLAGQPLELLLEDGRCAKIILAGLDGDFEITGPIAAKRE